MKNGTFVFLLMAVWVFIPLSVLPVHAEKIVAVFPTWAPYGYVEDGKAKGFEIEIFKAVMQEMATDVDFLHQPWKRCLYSVKNGSADVVISALKVEERLQYLLYPEEPISISETALFTREDRQIEYDGSFEKLKGYTIGITNGFSYGDAFDNCDFLHKDASTQTEAVVIKVLLGRNELGAGNIAVIRMIERQQKPDKGVRFLKPLLHSQKLYAAFSKVNGHEVLVERFSDELARFKKSDEYRKIMKKYGMNSSK